MDRYLENINVEHLVRWGLIKLISEDIEIIRNDLEERTITHKLANCIEYVHTSNLLNYFKPSVKVSVDVEYNRHIDLPKECVPYGNRFPDIIVHERYVDYNNYLIIEAKKTPENNDLTNDGFSNEDREKIICHLRRLYFRYGCQINFDEANEHNRSSYVIFSLDQYGEYKPYLNKQTILWSEILGD